MMRTELRPSCGGGLDGLGTLGDLGGFVGGTGGILLCKMPHP
jgi:hypothetical protein